MISGILLGAQDRKSSMQGLGGVILAPPLCIAGIVAVLYLAMVLLPNLALEQDLNAVGAWIVEFFSNE